MDTIQKNLALKNKENIIEELKKYCDNKCTITVDGNEKLKIVNQFGNTMTVDYEIMLQKGLNIERFLDYLKIYSDGPLCDISVSIYFVDRVPYLRMSFAFDDYSFILTNYPDSWITDELKSNHMYSIASDGLGLKSVTIKKSRNGGMFKFNPIFIDELIILKNIIGNKYDDKYFEKNYKIIFSKIFGKNPSKYCSIDIVGDGHYVIKDTVNIASISNLNESLEKSKDSLLCVQRNCEQIEVDEDNINSFKMMMAKTLKIEEDAKNLSQFVNNKINEFEHKAKFANVLKSIPDAADKLMVAKQQKQTVESETVTLQVATPTDEQILQHYSKYRFILKTYKGTYNGNVDDYYLDQETFRAICKEEGLKDLAIDILAYINYTMDADTRAVLFLN